MLAMMVKSLKNQTAWCILLDYFSYKVIKQNIPGGLFFSYKLHVALSIYHKYMK